MTDRHDTDRHDPAASVPPDHDLPTAGHEPPQPGAQVPDDDPTVISAPGASSSSGPGARPADPDAETEPIALPAPVPDVGQEAGSRTARAARRVNEPGARRGDGEEVTTRLIAAGGEEGPTVEQERPAADDPNGPTRRLRSGPGEWTEPTGHQEPEPDASAERVNRPGGVDIPVAVGNGDGLVPNDDLAETADRAAEAAGRPDDAERGGETGAESLGEVSVNGGGANRWRLSSAGALIWVLLALFGFTLVVQLRSNTDDQGLASARQEDLVAILSDLEARDSRLQTEITGLESSQRQLTSGVSSRQAALAEAAKRADELGLLAGTLPGKGPGLKIVIDKVKASAILNAVEELRGAGGEVMELAGANGVTVRIVASSYFVDAEGGGIVADGARVTGPYTLWVIGSPQTMQTALQIPGGVVASVNSAGGSVTMEAQTLVQVTAVRKATTLQYAHPVS
jgi:uncharacterized protein YlxW (UPF0749 family)